jgi:formate hydrogenlyase subunit 3/multisubunit Na+/H+ antiporter MnhD subunit
MRGVVSGLIAALTFTVIFIPLTFLMSGFCVGPYLLLMPMIHLICGCLGGIVSRNIKR